MLCAHLAAGLPYRRADEPLTVVFHINLLVSRRGEDVLAALKASLADSLPKSKSPNPKTPQVSPNEGRCAECNSKNGIVLTFTLIYSPPLANMVLSGCAQ